ncbi:hypothetical protein RhiirA5_430291 [Rhizophagus irregularis]|uniref:Uncharacterized protein n=3 Tax=Rhizophagus irregularis TaxID=588596 RepID=A0A2I1EQY7_9GLOM|nr:hypothetical protein GLOIN_2v1779628 [Rhizophagus irregularis DAOM 181602=DAOM 197198]PKB99097.1 hypothetical protein RhiirA5_430291 [Rhizophagus irregularis]PKC69697.1 hypothetical protein RhiirA1_455693 [Rhizophagus irregularis]PKK60891.1 hypothetical protein RhiirC2_856608 [Rhizophagus irregularis]PKY24552.1 hypothetical protein RhiirB3_439165 [Rhizophagus irregularis]POG67199.1 hypothetical protein GLOIN_2v1779628 [Rhizophagus irregularis DAOM 181602=DAOM 197198]|eukprot:XP_025174065.1 hypothetical protein GLOIN_2v1779628 [Rhizophagus irregularis DAOM 181602=DAOM 197198]
MEKSIDYFLGGRENSTIGVSLNTVARALDSACNGICTLIQFYESCTVVKLSRGGGDDDFCSLLKRIYDQLECGDVSGLAENTDKLKIGIIKAQEILSERLNELRPLSDSARKTRNASLIATVASAAASIVNPNAFTFACMLSCFGVFLVSSLAFSMIEYQIRFHEEARTKITNLYTELIKARVSSTYSLDSRKSGEYADAIRALGRTLKCTCF